MSEIELGDKVKCKITGFTGIVIARSDWLYGCVRFVVQPQSPGKGESIRFSTESFDEPQLELLKKGVVENTVPKAPAQRKHGPRPEIRRHD